MSSSSDRYQLEEVKREIDYQVQQYRHHRTEASRFLRILIAFLGILGAIFSGLDRITSSSPLPQLTPQKAAQAGETLNEGVPEVVPFLPEFVGELLVQWAILFAVAWLCAGVILTLVGVPSALYNCLKVREIRRVPQGDPDAPELAYRGLLRSNHRELVELEDIMARLYWYIRTTVWGLAFALAAFAAIAWEQLTTIGIPISFILLFIFVGTEIDLKELGTPQKPLRHKFDILSILAGISALLVSLENGILNIPTITGLVLISIVAFWGFYITKPNESNLFRWLMRKSVIQAVFAAIVGFQILIIHTQPPSWLVSVAVILFSFSVGVGYLVVLVLMCTAFDVLFDGGVREFLEKIEESFRDLV